jgi:hypothetical protein
MGVKYAIPKPTPLPEHRMTAKSGGERIEYELE